MVSALATCSLTLLSHCDRILQNFLGFGQSADIDIVFNDSENRKYAECRVDESGKKEKLLLYYDGETISGKVSVDFSASFIQLSVIWLHIERAESEHSQHHPDDDNDSLSSRTHRAARKLLSLIIIISLDIHAIFVYYFLCSYTRAPKCRSM